MVVCIAITERAIITLKLGFIQGLGQKNRLEIHKYGKYNWQLTNKMSNDIYRAYHKKGTGLEASQIRNFNDTPVNVSGYHPNIIGFCLCFRRHYTKSP